MSGASELRHLPLAPVVLHLCEITQVGAGGKVSSFTLMLNLQAAPENMESSMDSEKQQLIETHLEPLRWFVFIFIYMSSTSSQMVFNLLMYIFNHSDCLKCIRSQLCPLSG